MLLLFHIKHLKIALFLNGEYQINIHQMPAYFITVSAYVVGAITYFIYFTDVHLIHLYNTKKGIFPALDTYLCVLKYFLTEAILEHLILTDFIVTGRYTQDLLGI